MSVAQSKLLGGCEMKIDQYLRIMTAVRVQWILSVCGTAVTSYVKRGLQEGHGADRHNARAEH